MRQATIVGDSITMVIEASGNVTAVKNADPVSLWHFSQWQALMR
jgi:hypothetical protein